MWVAVCGLGFVGILTMQSEFIPSALLTFWEHSLLRNTLLSLDTGTMDTVLVLPQSNVTVFVDSPWEATHSLRSGWVVGWEEGGGSKRKLGRGKRDWYAKYKKNVLKKEKYVMHNVIIYGSNNIKINFNHSVFLMKIKDTQFNYFAEINFTMYSGLL